MALYSKNGEKLIFAPTGTPTTGSSGTQTPDGPAPPSASGSAPQFLKHRDGLHRSHLHPTDPILQFHSWYTAVSDPSTGVGHPETCTLSTASLPSGRVSARMVYLKELDAQGFVVYSNFGTSGKARDLFGVNTSDAESTQRQPNPWAALTFWWESQERQVRVEGRVHRLAPSESQVYYDTRARGSRIGAWASRQSAVVRPDASIPDDDGRAQLETWVAETEERFKGQEQIPVPEFWGGLRIVPERIEFWQGRDSRLHDRFVYDKVEEEEGKWSLERLSP